MSRRQGSVKAHGKGKWRLRWHPPNSSQKSEVVAGTKKEAEARLREILGELDQGVHVEASKVTLDDYLDSWLVTQARSISGRTLANNRLLLSTHVRPVLGACKLQDITVRQCQDLLDRLSERRGKALGSRIHRMVRGLLKQALDDAVRFGQVRANVAALVKLPKRGPETRADRHAWSADELKRFLKAAKDTKHETLWHFLAGTGCRPGEALAITWADLDFDAATVTIAKAITKDEASKLIVADTTKNGKTRIVPLDADLIARLRRHKLSQTVRSGSAGLVFGSALGTPLSIGSLRDRFFKPICAAAGIELLAGDGPYCLRHTHCSLLINSGVPVATVAARVGDVPQTNIAHYLHESDPEAGTRAAEAFEALLR